MKKVLCKDDTGYKLYLTSSNYSNNGRIYLGLLWFDENSGDYELWDDLTINLSDFMVESDNVIFINNDISDYVLEQLEEIGLLTYLDTMVYNYGRYKKYYLDRDVMREYLETE